MSVWVCVQWLRSGSSHLWGRGVLGGRGGGGSAPILQGKVREDNDFE